MTEVEKINNFLDMVHDQRFDQDWVSFNRGCLSIATARAVAHEIRRLRAATEPKP